MYWLLSACIATLLVVSIGRRWFLVVIVQGNSMAPVYNDGDMLLAVRRPKSHSWRPGDILVFTRTDLLEILPEDPKYLVKRVIAVPGDSVAGLPFLADSANQGLMPEGRLLLQGTGAAQTSSSYYAIYTDAVLGSVVCRLRRAG
jgi:hypothetical protein